MCGVLIQPPTIHLFGLSLTVRSLSLTASSLDDVTHLFSTRSSDYVKSHGSKMERTDLAEFERP